VALAIAGAVLLLIAVWYVRGSYTPSGQPPLTVLVWNGGFNSVRLMPGDAIVVPPRLRAGTTLRALKDWTQVFSQFALGIAAVRTFNLP